MELELAWFVCKAMKLSSVILGSVVSALPRNFLEMQIFEIKLSNVCFNKLSKWFLIYAIVLEPLARY